MLDIPQNQDLLHLLQHLPTIFYKQNLHNPLFFPPSLYYVFIIHPFVYFVNSFLKNFLNFFVSYIRCIRRHPPISLQPQHIQPSAHQVLNYANICFRNCTLCKPNRCSHEKICKHIMLTKIRRATPAHAPTNYVNFLVLGYDLGLHNQLPQEKQILLCFTYHFKYTCYCYYCHYYRCPSMSFHKLL